MIIYILGDKAFAEVAGSYLLHICSKEELANASKEEIEVMIENALKVKEMQNARHK